MSAIDDAFWAQIEGDAKRTVLCEPHMVDEVQAAVEARGFGNLITVRAHRYCPEGKLLIIDEAAMEASHRQMVQGFMKGRFFLR
ncbi:hypothetical protein [Streptomyces sp. NPDC102487]|uniref:hypothetical protein n=1 Tax=Streptomyces sp. NPDC102487 TaxID=3366182 RepID=UPI003826825E